LLLRDIKRGTGGKVPFVMIFADEIRASNSIYNSSGWGINYEQKKQTSVGH
jgi:hypothetical protein